MKENKTDFDGMIEFWISIPKIPKNIRGIKFKSKCACGGIITAMRSTYNGHLHAYCDKCDRKLMQ